MSGDDSATHLLQRWNDGDQGALAELVPIVEAELRRLARGYLKGERDDHTLQTTALMNEAYIRLIAASARIWQNRAHFIGMSARVMRQVLVDHARKRHCDKRGGSISLVAFDDARDTPQERDLAELLGVHEALERLEALDPRQARIVELKVFGGLMNKEIAEVVDASLATVKREWYAAKAWLFAELNDASP